MTSETPTSAEPRIADYERGWREGAAACLRELMTRDLGGFLSGPKKNGVAEEWIAVGDIFAVIGDVQEHPQTPRLKDQSRA